MSSCLTRRCPQLQRCWRSGWPDSGCPAPRGADRCTAPRCQLPSPRPRPSAVPPAPLAPQRGSRQCAGMRPDDRSRLHFGAWNRDAAGTLRASHSTARRSRHQEAGPGVNLGSGPSRVGRTEGPIRMGHGQAGRAATISIDEIQSSSERPAGQFLLMPSKRRAETGGNIPACTHAAGMDGEPADSCRDEYAAPLRLGLQSAHVSEIRSAGLRHSLSPFGIRVSGTEHRRLRIKSPSLVERAEQRRASSCQETARPRSARSRRVTLQ